MSTTIAKLKKSDLHTSNLLPVCPRNNSLRNNNKQLNVGRVRLTVGHASFRCLPTLVSHLLCALLYTLANVNQRTLFGRRTVSSGTQSV